MTSESPKPKLVTSVRVIQQAGLIHRVQQPSGAGPFPTVVMLHGRAGTEDVMWVFAPTLPPDWLIVAPRGSQLNPDGGYDWLRRGPDEWPALAEFDETVTAVSRFIRALPTLYQADPEQIYLMGFSQGAAAAYATAMRQPELVQGIAGLVGFVPEDCDDAARTAVLRDLPIFMAVGKQDPLIPFQRAQTCAQTLTAAGAHLTYVEQNTGHKLSAEGVRALKAWWQQFT
ncbi:MAG: dienelactone hydrolase family protein [Chloroflexota bacterium]